VRLSLNTVYAVIRHVGTALAITLGILNGYYPDQHWMVPAVAVLAALGFQAVTAQSQLLPTVKVPADSSAATTTSGSGQ
jgi:hypothetical protein